MLRGTTTTCVGAVPDLPGVARPCGNVPGEKVEFPGVVDPPERRCRDPLDEPLQAAPSNAAAITAANQKRLQARNHRVDSIVMEATQFYRLPHASPDGAAPANRDELEARVAELERVVATLAALQRERAVDRRRVEPNDPVAITRALHARGTRRSRSAKRAPAGDGTVSVRAVLFQPPFSR